MYGYIEGGTSTVITKFNYNLLLSTILNQLWPLLLHPPPRLLGPTRNLLRPSSTMNQHSSTGSRSRTFLHQTWHALSVAVSVVWCGGAALTFRDALPKGCQAIKSIREGSFFARSHLGLDVIVELMHFWSKQVRSSLLQFIIHIIMPWLPPYT